MRSKNIFSPEPIHEENIEQQQSSEQNNENVGNNIEDRKPTEAETSQHIHTDMNQDKNRFIKTKSIVSSFDSLRSIPSDFDSSIIHNCCTTITGIIHDTSSPLW